MGPKLPWYYSWWAFVIFTITIGMALGATINMFFIQYNGTWWITVAWLSVSFIWGTFWGVKRGRYVQYLKGEEIRKTKGAQNENKI